MTKQIQKQVLQFGLPVVFTLIIILLGTTFITSDTSIEHSTKLFSAEYNKEVGTEVEEGIKNLLAEGRYKCCLENPCSYCFVDKEHQDKDLVCDCLTDIMNGKHPCGECIGEILEGKGNALIAEYFATSLSEEVGEQHLETLQKIIAEKYNIPVTEQI